MMNRICLFLAIVCATPLYFAPQVAHAECWTGESAHARSFSGAQPPPT